MQRGPNKDLGGGAYTSILCTVRRYVVMKLCESPASPASPEEAGYTLYSKSRRNCSRKVLPIVSKSKIARAVFSDGHGC